MRGGKDYDATFGSRMKGEGVWADLIRQRFEKALTRVNIHKNSRFGWLDTSKFRKPLSVPVNKKRGDEQMDFFS